jgi:hypothetical protein
VVEKLYLGFGFGFVWQFKGEFMVARLSSELGSIKKSRVKSMTCGYLYLNVIRHLGVGEMKQAKL